MRYPKFLPKNGTIGFVAPSFGCHRNLTAQPLKMPRKFSKKRDIPWIWGQIAMKIRALASAIRQKPVRESWRNITAAVGMTF